MTTHETPALTEAELKLLQTLVYQECGMHFDDRRTPFLQDRLLRRLKERHLDSFYSYYRLLISKDGKQELSLLVENLTVNETSFFRNKAQLDLFQKDALDDLLRRKTERRDFSVRIWSAGCSTGQEPYTLAMLIADALSYYYLRRALRVAGAEAADTAAVAGRDPGQRHQLFGSARGAGGFLHRTSDGRSRLWLPLTLLR
jgi:chemotaxis protein methyltransferase CheR